jgi:membrane protease YdiL (CAAX protease family)
MVLFIALQLAAGFITVPGVRLLPQLTAEFLSLAALAWPLLRGVPWRTLREDIGWTTGRSPALEPVIGLGCNLMSIPALALGVAILLGLMALQKRLNGGKVEMPSHPVVQLLGSGDWRILVQLLILASLGAPLIEETMFRGVLYRHLREASGRMARNASILASATLASFVFAVVHPQGWMLIPALMALAFVFSVVREWRGTLIPSMVAHGVHNGVLVLIGFFVLGG